MLLVVFCDNDGKRVFGSGNSERAGNKRKGGKSLFCVL